MAIIIAYRHSDSRLQELILRVEGMWLKTELQINVILDIFSPMVQSTPRQERLLSSQQSCFDTLTSKLKTYLSKLKSLTGVDFSDSVSLHDKHLLARPIPRLRYALFEKHLQGLVTELERWQSIFDPSWYLLTRLVSPEVDRILEQAENDTSEQNQTVSNLHDIRAIVQPATQDGSPSLSSTLPTRNVPFLASDSISDQRDLAHGSGPQIGKKVDSNEVVVLDTTAYHEALQAHTILITVRQIARLLSIDDPFSMGFLNAWGW